jgi:aspartate carbamoyltransferase regulatory subunit
MACTKEKCASSDEQPCQGDIHMYKVDGGKWVNIEFCEYCDRAAEKVRKMGWKLTSLWKV